MAAAIARLDDAWLETLTWDLGLDDDEE
jgi:hypothetical protein